MANIAESLPAVTVVCGHYGVGKTNLALNLALDCARAGYETTLVDLDVVNPYFRTSDHARLLEEGGVSLIAPVLAGTTLDSPSLSGATVQAVEAAWAKPDACRVILDAGGDDVGATALGRFSHAVRAGAYGMLCVVNARRNLTQDPTEAACVLGQVERASRLRATGIVDNTHLQGETTVQTVVSSIPFAREVCELTGLPLIAVTVPRALSPCDRAVVGEAAKNEAEWGAYETDVLVRAPWE